MRDIIKDYGKLETEKRERGVLDEYAEMCRYQNERQRKNNEDFSDEDLTVDEQEDIDSGKEQNLKRENTQNEQIKEMGQVVLDSNSRKHKVELLTIIGEVEGHESAPSHSKTTKYEHVIPQLAKVEDDKEIDGLLIILNTVGGDVECGLAIAEMIAGMSKPTVSLVLGGSHSIGVPLAVSTDYSYIVETGTMVVHPVRMNGLFIGVPQTYDYFKKIQERINSFVVKHCDIKEKRFIKKRFFICLTFI